MTSHSELDEFAVREWFKTVDIEQARDTFRVVEGILEMRSVPKRARRKDAGTKRGQDPQIALADAGLRDSQAHGRQL